MTGHRLPGPDPAQNPNAPWWCWTDNEPSTFRCRELGHDVRPARKLGDPSTREWRAAVEQSTGARLRDALEANQQLAVDHARCVLEVERLRAELHRAHEAGGQVVEQLRQARDEIDRLTARIARQPGNYYLTAKGLAAIQPTDTQENT